VAKSVVLKGDLVRTIGRALGSSDYRANRIRGIGVLKAKSLAEAQGWISTDPMVKVGRLVFDLHAWMISKGILP
jgi:hypothetical protein